MPCRGNWSITKALNGQSKNNEWLLFLLMMKPIPHFVPQWIKVLNNTKY